MRSSPSRARVGDGGSGAVDLEPVGQRLGVGLVVVDDQTRARWGNSNLGRASWPPSSALAAGILDLSLDDPPSAPLADLDDQAGRNIENDVPRPGSDTTWIVPPCSSTVRRALESPRPVPPFLSDQYSSKQRASCSRSCPPPCR